MDVRMKHAHIPALGLMLLAGTLGGCAFPARHAMQMPDPGVIQTVRLADGREVLLPPDCAALLDPSRLDRPGGRRPDIAFGCATYTNLARSIARPQDLTRPAAHAGQDAGAAASAVQRYRDNEVTPLNRNSTLDSPAGSSGN
jgi:pilus assembly protein CpaD